MSASDLEARITRLEDIEAIKYLKALYCDICDDMHNPDRITSLFVEDGIWEIPGYGKAQGHDEIRALFQQFHNGSGHMTVDTFGKPDLPTFHTR